MKTKLHWGVILFALTWALALLLPPTRDAAHLFVSLRQDAQENGSAFSPPPSSDPIALVWNLEREMPSRARSQKWNDLVARYPDQPWLVASYLRATLSDRSWWQGNRLAVLKPEDTQARHNIEKAITFAARMQQKEPTNAYWPWLVAGFHFALGQRSQAMTAIQGTKDTSYFQDYNQSTLRDRIHWFDQHAHPTWEERQGLSYALFRTDIFFMIATIKEAGHEAGLARAHGDNNTALRIGTTLLHTNALWQRDTTTFLGAILARNTGYSVLEEILGQKIRTNGLYETRLRDQETLRKRWSQFARANGRTDVAKDADWLQNDANNPRTSAYSDRVWQQFGLPAPWGHIAALTPVFLWAVFGLCFGFALLWLMGCFLRRGVEGSDPTRGQVALCANFSFWALVGVGLLLGKSLMDGPNSGFDLVLFDFVSYQNATTLPILLSVVLALGCWLLPVAFLNWKRGRQFRWIWPEGKALGLPRRFSLWRAVAWICFLFFAAVVASDGNGMWDDTLLRPAVSATLAFLGLISVLTLEVIRYQRTGRLLPRLRVEGTPFASPVLRVWRWLRNGVFLIAIAGFLVFWAWGTRQNGETISDFALVGLGIGYLGVLATIALSIKTARRDRFSLELASKTAGVLSLVCSFAFLLLALGIWPLRIELNHQLDRRLNMKEVDWMDEQVAKNPIPSR